MNHCDTRAPDVIDSFLLDAQQNEESLEESQVL